MKKISIKREQSQAGLSFAEREKFRPQVKNKLLLLLVLLMTAATGAMAQTQEPAKTYNITLAEGTEDAENWKVKVGKGEAQAFPVEGLNGGETVTVTYNGSREVKSVTAVKKAAVDNTYLEWDPDKKQLVATAMPTTYNTVENASKDVTWEKGTYVVEGQVTIDGIITLNGDVDLIIKDGDKLTANKISGENKKLCMFGQDHTKNT